jgi:hypothetical protein
MSFAAILEMFLFPTEDRADHHWFSPRSNNPDQSLPLFFRINIPAHL